MTFSVAATGSPAPSYQWKKDGTDIAGATSSTLSLAAVSPSDAGNYSVLLVNASGSLLSSSATLTITPAPKPPVIVSFTTSPATVAQGQSATLSWTTTGATTLNIGPGVGDVTGLTTKTVFPTATTTYLLTASNSAGTTPSQGATLIVRPPALHVAIVVHSEDRHNRQTPDYQTDKAAYAASRAALLVFAQAMDSRQLKWNWQSDYNFLEACLKWEIQSPDAVLLALTGGKNVVRYLHEDLGVECDPHSHENDQYNYADIAALLEACGVKPTPVVGGHIFDPLDANYQHWPRFNAEILGHHSGYPWEPELMMGAATTNHRNDRAASGMWRPLSEEDFFSSGGSGIPAFGGWDEEASSIPALARQVATQQLAADKMWTFALVLAQQYFVQPDYLENQVLPALDQIASLRVAGTIEVVQFLEALEIWKSRYGSAEGVYQAPSPEGYITFTLNTQDFSYPEESSDLMTKVLDLHEAANVPIDVSFTTSQAVLFATQYPELWERLKGSSLVALSTHTRAPKPYANNFDWIGMGPLSQEEQKTLVLSYETWELDPETGQLTDVPGGYTQVKSLAGYAPFSIGAKADASVAKAVCSVLADLGARFVVAHGQTANLGDRTVAGLALKPEHVDLKLFESVGLDPGPILDAALMEATTIPGAEPPYFVGVKVHDNDFFAQESAWVTVYNERGRPVLTPDWDITKKAFPLRQSERDAMWRLYEETVRYAASIRAKAGLLNLRDVAGMLH